MSITHRCDSGLRCTFVVWDGEVTPQQWHAHTDDLFNDPSFPPGPLYLSDLRTASTAPITGPTIEDIAIRWNRLGEALSPLRVAIVPSEAWSKAEQFVDGELTLPQVRAALFNDVSTACLWLDLSIDDAKQALQDLREQARRDATR